MSADQILQSHIELCDETYQILSEENNILKQHQKSIGNDFINRKTDLLNRLDDSIKALKALNSQPFSKYETTRALIKKAQQRLMQIMLLDRENERLLGSYKENSQKRAQSASTRKESFNRIQKAYEEFDSYDQPPPDNYE